MSKHEKLVSKFLSRPKDFTFDELCTLIEGLGLQKSDGGKTSGSSVTFSRGDVKVILHKPHPRKELLPYQVDRILKKLKRTGLL